MRGKGEETILIKAGSDLLNWNADTGWQLYDADSVKTQDPRSTKQTNKHPNAIYHDEITGETYDLNHEWRNFKKDETAKCV